MSLFGTLFSKFKQGLQRTQELVLAPMGRLLGLRRLDQEQLEELEDLLLRGQFADQVQAGLAVQGVDQAAQRLSETVVPGIIKARLAARGVQQRFLLNGQLQDSGFCQQ